ncbi:WASH complex subunit 3 [Drosophila rhopaloa]|uniref:WASH complex subunit CCDC53 homolog n=1 Tax=Drosophila rhopaloa TaxID=1041015 RepID=A0A6P4E5S2_DRORH|nr:WASH complex subunit 3 [Drosophila rhopaloa]
MDATSAITGDVDKTQIPPLNQKRILAFVNHFLVSTCTFLNEFALGCETKFVEMERQLQKTEAALIILEAKLASIPTEHHVTEEAPSIPAPSTETSPLEVPILDLELPAGDNEPGEPQAPPESLGVRACEDLRYRKFFKMVQVGVPAPAVKQKMQSEGLEPRLLDTPDLILADGLRE